MFTLSPLVALGGALVALLIVIKIYDFVRARGSARYPPGPPGDFLIGSESARRGC